MTPAEPDARARSEGKVHRLVGRRIRSVEYWDIHNLGSEPARCGDLPTALRLDFDAGSVWLAAAIPQPSSMTEVFIPGDEIMVVFSAEKIRAMGYGNLKFTA